MLVFKLASDADYVVMLGTDSSGQPTKRICTVCDAIYSALSDHGVPDTGVQFISLTQKTTMEDGASKNVLCRFDLSHQAQTAAFVPKALTDSELASPTVKKAMLGATFCGSLFLCMCVLCMCVCLCVCIYATFIGQFGKLPCRDGRVLWEMELSKAAPAQIRPVKAKLWLMGEVELTKGYYYKLE